MRAALILLALALPLPLQAHDCQDLPGNVLQVQLGRFATYRITAVIAESEPTDYSLFLNSEPAVAGVNPLQQSTYNYGEFLVRGLALGTTRVTLHWAYAPNNAAADCIFDVQVVAPAVTTGANAPNSTTAGDPVNTFTGELLMEPPPDLHLGGPLPLEFKRHYASGKSLDGLSPSALGYNWTHNFDWRLRRESDLAIVTMPDGRSAAFLLDAGVWVLQGLPTTPFALIEDAGTWRFADPRGNLVYSFNVNGRLTSLTDGQGNTLTLTYTGQNFTRVEDGKGRFLNLSYAGLNNISAVSDGTRSVAFSYNFLPALQSVTDADGFVTQYQYANPGARPGLLARMIRPEGNEPWTQAYDSLGRVATQVDALGNTTTYGYAAGSTTITAPDASTRVHAYGENGELTSETDETGKAVLYTYDAAGRLARVTDRLGRITRFLYHAPSGKRSRVTDPRDNYSQWGYRLRTLLGLNLYDVISQRNPDATTETYQRNALGLMTRRTEADGGVWVYQYSGYGQVTRITNPAGGVAINTYAADGTHTSSATPSGSKTFLRYDALRRLNRIEHPDGTVRTLNFNARDLITRIVDERGGITRYTFDTNGNRITRVDALGRSGSYGYDGLDRLVSWKEPEDAAARALEYDTRGYLAAFSEPGGNPIRFDPDVRGAASHLEDGAGRRWARTMDDELRITAVEDLGGHRWSFAFDGNDNQTTITLPSGRRHDYSFDAMDRRTQSVEPDGRTSTLSYDNVGRLTGIAGPAPAASANFTFDPLGRRDLVQRGATTLWDFDHDSGGQLNAVTDGLGRRTEYAHDISDRPSLVTFPGALGTLGLEYEGIDNIRRRSFSDGLVLDYGYDLNGRLISANGIALTRSTQGQVVDSNGIAVTRNSDQRIVSITYAAGKTVTYGYDAGGLLVSVADWLGGQTGFSWDTAGRLTSMTRPNGVTTSYEYDDDGRLRGIRDGNLADLRLTRDAIGRVAASLSTLPAADALDPASRARSFDAGDQVGGWSFDARGRLGDDLERQYTWDLDSRLQTAVAGGVTHTYGYDAFANRLSASASGATTDFVWNYATPLPSVAIERAAGVDQRYHVLAPDGRLLYSIVAATGARHFHHFDERGNTTFLSGDAGRILERYRYGAFGELLGGASKLGNRYTWQGRWGAQFDAGTGLYYMRARYYDPQAARFLSRDPLMGGEPRALNPYLYAMNDPVGFNDPMGLSAAPVSSTPANAPGSSPNNPVFVPASEWTHSVNLLKYRMLGRIRRAEYGWFDPDVANNFDSPYLRRQKEYFNFRGRVMNGGELNYYFQGMYWSEFGVSKDVMVAIIVGYKRKRYNTTPSANDLFAADQGYNDFMDSTNEIRSAALQLPETVTGQPIRDALGMGNAWADAAGVIVQIFTTPAKAP